MNDYNLVTILMSIFSISCSLSHCSCNQNVSGGVVVCRSGGGVWCGMIGKHGALIDWKTNSYNKM